jgi:hypothetical protein
LHPAQDEAPAFFAKLDACLGDEAELCAAQKVKSYTGVTVLPPFLTR